MDVDAVLIKKTHDLLRGTGMTEDGHCNEELLEILVKVALRATKVHMRHSDPARTPSNICQDAAAAAATIDDEGTHEDTWG